MAFIAWCFGGLGHGSAGIRRRSRLNLTKYFIVGWWLVVIGLSWDRQNEQTISTVPVLWGQGYAGNLVMFDNPGVLEMICKTGQQISTDASGIALPATVYVRFGASPVSVNGPQNGL